MSTPMQHAGTPDRDPAGREDSRAMRPLKYAINITVDGCVDHMEGRPDEELHQHHAGNLARADALLFGRVTYQMMEAAWKGANPDRPAWMEPFAQTIDAARKHVVSRTLTEVDWNAELIRDDLEPAVRALKAQPGAGLITGGVTLPSALAHLGLIDEFEFLVHPRIAGHGPRLFDGLPNGLDLTLVERRELRSGAVVLNYVPAITGPM